MPPQHRAAERRRSGLPPQQRRQAREGRRRRRATRWVRSDPGRAATRATPARDAAPAPAARRTRATRPCRRASPATPASTRPAESKSASTLREPVGRSPIAMRTRSRRRPRWRSARAARISPTWIADQRALAARRGNASPRCPSRCRALWRRAAIATAIAASTTDTSAARPRKRPARSSAERISGRASATFPGAGRGRVACARRRGNASTAGARPPRRGDNRRGCLPAPGRSPAGRRG